MTRACLIFMLTLMVCPTVRAEVRLPQVLGSHMVLQRDTPVTLWGWADPGEQVTATIGDHKLATVAADAEGRWRVQGPARPAGGPVQITLVAGNSLTLDNVMFGDVWVCSGQSNMDFPMFRSQTATEDIADADRPGIRLFTVTRTVAPQPLDDCEGKWVVCDTRTVRSFSAVGYYFGRELHDALDLPVGLIRSTFGGTPGEAWTPYPTLEARPEHAHAIERRAQYPDDYARLQTEYETAMQRWQEQADKAKAESKPAPRQPRRPVPPERNPLLASVLYNAMIHPLTPLPIQGVIWYQGENNTSRPEMYQLLLSDLITAWRQAWRQPDMPFGVVQLTSFMAPDDQPRDSFWARLREAQARTARNLPHTGLAVTIDIGDDRDIHPRNKKDVGHRLALWALAQVYGRDVVWQGPTLKDMTVRDGAAVLTFDHADGGLQALGGGDLAGFAIAGEDRQFVWAQATIEGAQVVVRSPQVAVPVAVRYAWGNNPRCNLVNGAGLPAGPFRSDDWPNSLPSARR